MNSAKRLSPALRVRLAADDAALIDDITARSGVARSKVVKLATRIGLAALCRRKPNMSGTPTPPLPPEDGAAAVASVKRWSAEEAGAVTPDDLDAVVARALRPQPAVA